jgi:hypothetical protein
MLAFEMTDFNAAAVTIVYNGEITGQHSEVRGGPKTLTKISARPATGGVAILLYDALDFSTYCYGRRG